jgi:hypothetical protein
MNYPKSSLPSEDTQSLDDKIAAENIRQSSYKNGEQQPPSSAFGYVHTLSPLVNRRSISLLAVVVVVVSGGFITANVFNNHESLVTTKPTPALVDKKIYAPTEQTPSVSGNEANSGSDESGIKSNALPSSPGSVRLSAASTNISITWNKVPQVTQYVVDISSNRNMSSDRLITSGGTSTTIVGLSPSTSYYIRVLAVGSAGKGPWSAIASIQTRALTAAESATPYPGKVAGQRISGLSSTSVAVSWDKVSHATWYTVIRASNSAMTLNVKEYAPTSGLSYTMADLASGSTYYIAIKASNVRGFGPASKTVTAKTRLGVPALSELAVFADNTLSASFTRSNGATSYELLLATRSDFVGGSSIHTSATSLKIPSLSPGVNYYLQVRAKDSSYTTAWSRSRSIHTTVAVPSGVGISNITSASFSAAWSKVTGSSKYEARLSESSSMSGSISKPSMSTSISLSALKASTTYYFQVRAFDGLRWTAWSPQKSVMTSTKTVNFKMASFNVLKYGSTLPGGNYPSWPSADVRMTKTLSLMNQQAVDVAGFQELKIQQWKKFNSLAGANWGMYPSTPNYTYSLGEASIVWRTSRFKFISGGQRTDLVANAGARLYVPWVILQDKIDGKKIYISNAHDPTNTQAYSGQAKYRVANAKHHRDNLATQKIPSFMAGDYNSTFSLRSNDAGLTRAQLTYCIITSANGLRNAYDVFKGRGGACPSTSGGGVDNIYMNSLSNVSNWQSLNITMQQHISDHPMLIITVRLK